MSEILKPIDPLQKPIDPLFIQKEKSVFTQQKPIDCLSKPIDPIAFIIGCNVQILQKSTDSFAFNALQQLQSCLWV